MTDKMTVEQALRKAYQLGQDYWRQADSESYRESAKSYATQQAFDELVEEMVSLNSGEAE